MEEKIKIWKKLKHIAPRNPMYVIKRPGVEAYLKEGVMPPRLSDFTKDLSEAQMFEIKREAEYCCKFICDYAFLMEVVETNENSTRNN